MSVTEAMEEARAANPAGEVEYETLELDHVTFVDAVPPGPAYILASGGSDNIDLPLTLGGDPVTFIYCPATVTPPGVTEDGPTPMKIRVNNISNYLLPYLRLAKNSTEPITITYRAYTSTDLTQPGEVLSGYRLGAVSLDPYSAEATVTLREIEMQAFPLRTYDEEYYPTLQNN